jgi:para-nitrobenzyl esterase
VVIPRPVLETFREGLQNPVPILIGTNANESSILAASLYGAPVRDAEEFQAKVIAVAGESIWNAAKPLYTVERYGSAQKALVQLSTDSIFTCPARRILRAAAASGAARAWRYVFSHTSRTPLLHRYGAGHGLEMPYVFGFMPGIPLLGFTPAERALSATMQDAWTGFAATLDPGWADFSSGEAYRDFDLQSVTGQGFRDAECDALDGA